KKAPFSLDSAARGRIRLFVRLGATLAEPYLLVQDGFSENYLWSSRVLSYEGALGMIYQVSNPSRLDHTIRSGKDAADPTKVGGKRVAVRSAEPSGSGVGS